MFRYIEQYDSNKQTSCNKYKLSLANPCDALHHGKSAVNKGGRSV